jgi:hypothetical protein
MEKPGHLGKKFSIQGLAQVGAYAALYQVQAFVRARELGTFGLHWSDYFTWARWSAYPNVSGLRGEAAAGGAFLFTVGRARASAEIGYAGVVPANPF